VFAYACEPQAGSEDGAGWIWSLMLARLAETWVVTRENNKPAIDRALTAIPETQRPNFVYVDLPEWARFWKRGNRGARPYYVLWQGVAVRAARSLDRRLSFDLVWHLTMSTVWLGSLGPFLGKRFGWGPVGGGVTTPWMLAPALGPRGCVFEASRNIAQSAGRYVNPMARYAWRRATLILTQNPDTREWFPPRHHEKTVVFPHIVLDGGSPGTATTRTCAGDGSQLTLLYAGRLLPWKGVALSLRVLVNRPGWRLVVAGTGPDEDRLRRIAERLGVSGQVEFMGWVDRHNLMELMRTEADVFLFPSLHDEGGWVVVEALASGLPVVCLNRGGPPVLGGRGVPVGSMDETVAGLDEAIKSVATKSSTHPIPTIDNSVISLAGLLRRAGMDLTRP
jgi:glycosyltransferase involved in cell wall biosynthesis